MPDVEQEQVSQETEVAIIGAGILGLTNALQFAKRGFDVTLIDNIVQQKRSFKVGESLLIFSNPFLRMIGGLDEFIHNSFPKDGVWFVYGMEGRESFDGRTEWAFQSKIPKRWQDNMVNQTMFRSMFYDAQIVRPEAEDLLRDRVRATPNIRFLDTAKVKGFSIAEDDASPHSINYECGKTKALGTVKARWLIDCSGRTRLLAKSLKHASESREMNDGFQTTAVWAQFDHIEDEMFAEDAWAYNFEDGARTLRDRNTAHLWGEGYWIWVIRLSNKRISIGATWDQKQAPPGNTPKEQFWEIINRYPLLTRALKEEHVLEFRQYKDVQYMTDTFVSQKRYGMVGDAGSIIDAYYSQGVSLSLITSWHIANIMEGDLRHNMLDRAYIERVNRATRQDWHMMRNTIVEKYTSAIKDPRFFILSHFLDFVMFSCILSQRWQLVRWLVETESDPSRETIWHKEVRARLRKTLYYSQTPPWNLLAPETVQKLQGKLQRGLGERARWRLENGVDLPEVKAIARAYSLIPNLFRMITADRSKLNDISPSAVELPDNMLFKGTEDSPLPFRIGGPTMLAMFLAMYGYDAAETGVRKMIHKAMRALPARSRHMEEPVIDAKASTAASSARLPWGETLRERDPMPDIVLTTSEGRERRLADYWREKPTAFVFIRHFGCPHCRAELMRLKRDREQVESLGGQIVGVTMGTPAKTAEFRASLSLTFPLLADPEERAYAACGLHLASNTLGSNLKAFAEDAPVAAGMMARGEYGKFVFGGNDLRMGGTFVVDHQGRIAYIFRSQSTAATPPFENILRAFRQVARVADQASTVAVTGEVANVPNLRAMG